MGATHGADDGRFLVGVRNRTEMHGREKDPRGPEYQCCLRQPCNPETIEDAHPTPDSLGRDAAYRDVVHPGIPRALRQQTREGLHRVWSVCAPIPFETALTAG